MIRHMERMLGIVIILFFLSGVVWSFIMSPPCYGLVKQSISYSGCIEQKSTATQRAGYRNDQGFLHALASTNHSPLFLPYVLRLRGKDRQTDLSRKLPARISAVLPYSHGQLRSFEQQPPSTGPLPPPPLFRQQLPLLFWKNWFSAPTYAVQRLDPQNKRIHLWRRYRSLPSADIGNHFPDL